MQLFCRVVPLVGTRVAAGQYPHFEAIPTFG
jgi:hypothetical protein